MSKQEQFINKIEIDPNTAEPKIVEVPADSIVEENKPQENTPAQEIAEKEVEPLVRGEQLEMPKVQHVGFKYNEETSINKRQKLFKNIFYILFIVVVVGVLVFTAYNDFGSGKKLPSWNEVATIFKECWYYAIFALLALAFFYFFKGFKLSIMCKYQTKKWHLRTCIETGVLGSYYNNITPLAVGGQPFEIYHLSKHGIHGGVASSLPIVAFFLNQLAFVIIGIVSLILFKTNVLNIPEKFINAVPQTTVSIIAIIGLVLCLFIPLLTILFSLTPKAGASLVKVVVWLGSKFKIVKNPKLTTYKTLKTVINNSKCIKKISTNPIVFISTFLLSFGEQLAISSIAYFTLRFYGYDLPNVGGMIEWLQVIQLCSILYAAISFIPTPGNSGAADLSFYLLFEVGLAGGLAFPAMLTWRLFSFYSTIIIGFIVVRIIKRRDKKELLKQKI